MLSILTSLKFCCLVKSYKDFFFSFFKVVRFRSHSGSKKLKCKHYTWSVIEGPPITSTYSQNAYPLESPVALSFTKLKAFNGPKDVKSSFTLKKITKEKVKTQFIIIFPINWGKSTALLCLQSPSSPVTTIEEQRDHWF